MFGPLCGGPEDIPGAPASEPPRPGSRRWRVAALLGCLRRNRSSDSNEAAGTYQVEVTEASFPTEQRLGQTSLLKLGDPQHRQEDGPGADGDDHDRRQGRARLLAALRRSTIRRPGWRQADRPVWVLAAELPAAAGSSEPGGATTSNRKTFAFGPLKPGKTHRRGLEAERGQGRQVHARSTGSTPASAASAKAETDNGVAPGGSFVAEITQRTAGNRSQRRRRNRRNQAAERRSTGNAE